MFELVRFSSGGAWQGTRLPSADLDEAIRLARDLIKGDDPLSVIEVRRDGHAVFTIGVGWTSCPARDPSSH
jgi:hypothetical protein